MYHISESAGRMIDISNAQHNMLCQAGSLHTVLAFEASLRKVHLLALNKNRLSGFWFQNYLHLDRTVYDRSAKYSPVCFENLIVHTYSWALADQCFQSFQGSVKYSEISSVLSVRKSVSDCLIKL
jgi:hypothetical protein